VTLEGGEGLKGAGQVNFLGDLLSEEDWRALKPGRGG
jgi:hypothetical protein